MKKEKVLNNLLLAFPFIDFLTAIATWENLLSIGVLIRGIFLLFAICFLFKKGFEKKSLWLFLGIFFFYFLFQMGFLCWFQKESLYIELSNLIKIFYLPILIVYFKEEESKIKSSTISKILLCYLLLYLVPYPFHLGHNMNELYANKDLYLSYFYIGNELANVFILLTPIVLYNLIKEKKPSLPFYVILTLLMIFLLGTKALYGSIVLIFLFFLYEEKEKVSSFLKKHISFIGILSVTFIAFLVLWLPKSDFYQNIKTTLEFYKIEKISDLFTIQNIDHVVFSDRLSNLNKVSKEYHESSLFNQFFGMGRGTLLKIKDVEIDFFDIYYSIGIIGTCIYFFCMFYALRKTKWQKRYHFLFFLMIFLSCITGHVLLSPMISTYLALLFSLNKEEQKEK